MADALGAWFSGWPIGQPLRAFTPRAPAAPWYLGLSLGCHGLYLVITYVLIALEIIRRPCLIFVGASDTFVMINRTSAKSSGLGNHRIFAIWPYHRLWAIVGGAAYRLAPTLIFPWWRCYALHFSACRPRSISRVALRGALGWGGVS